MLDLHFSISRQIVVQKDMTWGKQKMSYQQRCHKERESIHIPVAQEEIGMHSFVKFHLIIAILLLILN